MADMAEHDGKSCCEVTQCSQPSDNNNRQSQVSMCKPFNLQESRRPETDKSILLNLASTCDNANISSEDLNDISNAKLAQVTSESQKGIVAVSASTGAVSFGNQDRKILEVDRANKTNDDCPDSKTVINQDNKIENTDQLIPVSEKLESKEKASNCNIIDHKDKIENIDMLQSANDTLAHCEKAVDPTNRKAVDPPSKNQCVDKVSSDGETDFVSALRDKFDEQENDETVHCVIFISRSVHRKSESGDLLIPPRLTLSGYSISKAGCVADLSHSLLSVTELDLSFNKLTDWKEVFSIIDHMPKLWFIDLTGNELLDISENELRDIPSHEKQSDETATVSVTNKSDVQTDVQTSFGRCYASVTQLVLNFTGISFSTVMWLLKIMPRVKDLHLCYNRYYTIDLPAVYSTHPFVESVYLSANLISSWSEIEKLDAVFPNLQQLVAMENPLKDLSAPTKIASKSCTAGDDKSQSVDPLGDQSKNVDQLGSQSKNDDPQNNDKSKNVDSLDGRKSVALGFDATCKERENGRDQNTKVDSLWLKQTLIGNESQMNVASDIIENTSLLEGSLEVLEAVKDADTTLWKASNRESVVNEKVAVELDICDNENEIEKVIDTKKEVDDTSDTKDSKSSLICANMLEPCIVKGKTINSDSSGQANNLFGVTELKGTAEIENCKSTLTESTCETCTKEGKTAISDSAAQADNLSVSRISNSEISSNNLADSGAGGFQKLCRLCLTRTALGRAEDLEQLTLFPVLTDVKLIGIPFLEKAEEKFRRQLLIGYLPNVTLLNGSPVSDNEREDAERAFIRHYLFDSNPPQSYHRLISKHGELMPLVEVDLTAKDFVYVTVRYEGRAVLQRVSVHDTAADVKRRVAQIVRKPAHQLRMFHFTPNLEYGTCLMNFPKRTILNYRLCDGDEIICEMKLQK